jgi:hypothetical protein
LPVSISSSCCSMLASSCLHQAMKRSGADMALRPYCFEKREAQIAGSVKRKPREGSRAASNDSSYLRTARLGWVEPKMTRPPATAPQKLQAAGSLRPKRSRR